MAFRKTYRFFGLGAVAILSLVALANPVWAVAIASAGSHAGGNGHGVATNNPHLADDATVTPSSGPAAETPTVSTSTTPVAAPAVSSNSGTSGSPLQPQPRSNADNNGRGANVTGGFDSTRDGSASHNGNATGQPPAGSKGKADNKNPPGQLQNDHNRGYECDGNRGVGKTNPAHTGCPSTRPPTNPPPRTCVIGDSACPATTTQPPATPPAQVLGLTLTRDPGTNAAVLGSTQKAAVAAGTLPRTGANVLPLVLLALVLLGAGLALTRWAEPAAARSIQP